MARQGNNIISFDDVRRYASTQSDSHSSGETHQSATGRRSARSQGMSDSGAFAPLDAFDDLAAFESPFSSSRRAGSGARIDRGPRFDSSSVSRRSSAEGFSSVSRSGRISRAVPSWYDEGEVRASRSRASSLHGEGEGVSPRAAVEAYGGPSDDEREGSSRESRQGKKKRKLKDKAEKMFARQFGSSDSSAEGGPRAAVYKGEMGKSHKRAFAEMGGTQRDGRASSSGTSKAKKVRSSAASRIAIAVGCLVCVAAVLLFLYPTARQVYVESREEDRLQAEYDALIARNNAMQDRIDYLKTDEGIEDTARQQLGWVKEGETAVVVDGLSDDSGTEDSSVNIQIVSGSIPAPQTWYSPVLDVVFGYVDPSTSQKSRQGDASATSDGTDSSDAASSEAGDAASTGDASEAAE